MIYLRNCLNCKGEFVTENKKDLFCLGCSLALNTEEKEQLRGQNTQKIRNIKLVDERKGVKSILTLTENNEVLK